MELVAFLGDDRENWGQVTALLKRMKWDGVVIVKNKNNNDKIDFQYENIEVNSESSIVELKEEMLKKLKEKLAGEFEVALSIASGSGKEHMALISALLNIPVGIRIVVFTKNGVEFIN